MAPCAFRLFLFLLCAAVEVSPVLAADACRPARPLPALSTISLDRQSYDTAPRLKAVTVADLELPAGAVPLGELGPLKEGDRVQLKQPVIVTGVVLASDIIGSGPADLTFGSDSARLTVLSDGRRHAVDVRKGQAYGYNATAPLNVAPDLSSSRPFMIGANSSVTLSKNSRIVVRQGSTLEWDLNDFKHAVPLILRRSVVLEETNTGHSAARVLAVRPQRVLPGGSLQVEMQVPDFDFNSQPPTFCFSRARMPGAGAGDAVGVQGDLISRAGNTVVFQVRVPTGLHLLKKAPDGESLAPPWWALEPGMPFTLRVLAYGEDALEVDSSVGLGLTSRPRSVVAALIFTALMLIFSAVAFRNQRVFGPSTGMGLKHYGRYSLSNVQVCMWTMLVLFALCYVWYATGEILTISSGVLILLGISGVTTVSARTLEALQAPKDSVATQTASARDLITSEDGNIDLVRFQMLAFTIFTWIYAFVSVLKSEGLPEIPENLYLLMGISNATYVASKLPGAMGGTAGGTAGAPVKPGEDVLDAPTIRQIQAQLKVTQTGVLDAPTRDAIVAYKRAHNLIPATGTLDKLLIAKLLRPV
jgi:hypothetical protein